LMVRDPGFVADQLLEVSEKAMPLVGRRPG
jgi:hypothetical protein